jgi:hypothetical protein
LTRRPDADADGEVPCPFITHVVDVMFGAVRGL